MKTMQLPFDYAYFPHMKIHAAKRMLGEGMSIGETSDRLGYSSQAYMSLCFKKKMGVSPLAYKKSEQPF